MACDPDFTDVVLLAHFDGVGTAFVDSSSLNNPMTAIGNGSQVTSAPAPEFGAASMSTGTTTGSFNGVGVPNIAPFNPAGDFVIEFWIYLPLLSAGLYVLVDKNDFTSVYPFQILVNNGEMSANGADNAGGTVFTMVAGMADALTFDAWNYVVLQRSGSLFSLYVNGNLADTDTTPASLASTNTADLRIGTTNDTLSIDEFRFTSGIARYSGSTIPVPTGPFGVACPTQFAYPDFGVGTTTYAEAQAIIAASVFGALNPAVEQPNAGVAVGLIFLQSPAANSLQNAGTVGTVTVSTGAPSDNVVVPPIQKIGLTPQQANAILSAAGLVEGPIDFSTDPSGTAGTVFLQAIAAGTIVPRGTSVAYTVTSVLQPFDPSPTVISQYANSPTILALAFSMGDYLRPDVNFEAFYNFVWNVDTAQGFGLDIWGKIVGISRLLKIEADSPVFGFENVDSPPDWSPFNQGTFNSGDASSNTFILADPAYRTLILTKALANIVATTAPAMNRLLRNLFPNRGKCYVLDLGGMAMSFVFEFSLSTVELAILTQSGALPHPAGVLFSVTVSPSGGNFGFAEQGGDAQPFDEGVFA